MYRFLQKIPWAHDQHTYLDVTPVSTSTPRNFQEIFGSGYPYTQRVIESVSFSAQYLFSTTPGANHGAQAELYSMNKQTIPIVKITRSMAKLYL